MPAPARRRDFVSRLVAFTILQRFDPRRLTARINVNDSPSRIRRAQADVVVGVLVPPCVDLREIGAGIFETVLRGRLLPVLDAGENLYASFGQGAGLFVQRCHGMYPKTYARTRT